MALQLSLIKQKLKMDICLKHLGFNLLKLNNLIASSFKRLSQQFLCNMDFKCQLIVGLSMNTFLTLLPHFNQQELAMMCGQEIKEVINIAENIKHQTLMEKMVNFGNSVFKKWEIMIFQVIQSIYANKLGKKKLLTQAILWELHKCFMLWRRNQSILKKD